MPLLDIGDRACSPAQMVEVSECIIRTSEGALDVSNDGIDQRGLRQLGATDDYALILVPTLRRH